MPFFRQFHRKTVKALRLLRTSRYRSGLRHGVAATIEHRGALSPLDARTVIDVGAHQGAFSLLALEMFSSARVYAFEPLAGPRARFRRVLGGEKRVTLFPAAIGPEAKCTDMNVSGRADSSSLLPISERQERFFPGTGAVNTETVRVAPLHRFLSREEIVRPALLKIDVQGFEREVLRGCGRLLGRIDLVYVECSFVELYAGQALASDVVAWLHEREFTMEGAYNLNYTPAGEALQGDLLFRRGSRRKGSGGWPDRPE